jgi:hypothetical protein
MAALGDLAQPPSTNHTEPPKKRAKYSAADRESPTKPERMNCFYRDVIKK